LSDVETDPEGNGWRPQGTANGPMLAVLALDTVFPEGATYR
jgi:hypothetical protein